MVIAGFLQAGQRWTRAVLVGLAVIAGLGIAYYWATRSAAAAGLVFSIMLWASAATAWAIHAGPAGRLSLGHSAYFGIGAYVAAIVQVTHQWSFWSAVPIAFVLVFAIGASVELITGRLHGLYYSLVTFALAQLTWLLARSWTSLTNGTRGIVIPFDRHAGISRLMFDDPALYALAATVLTAGVVACSVALSRSRVGYFVRAIRDAPDAALAVGLVGSRWRPLTAGVSAGLTGLTGVLFAQHLLFVDPDSVLGFRVIISIMLPAILGGLHAVYGPLVGAVVLIVVRDQFLGGSTAKQAAAAWAIYGLVLAAGMLLLSDGLCGAANRIWTRVVPRSRGGQA